MTNPHNPFTVTALESVLDQTRTLESEVASPIHTGVGRAYRINQDEPAYWLSEKEYVGPGGHAWNRYQLIVVWRLDHLAEYWEDLGQREKFIIGPFQIPGGVQDDVTGRFESLHTVRELREQADLLRIGMIPPAEIEPKTDLAQRWWDKNEDRLLRKTGQSTFGPGGTVIRG